MERFIVKKKRERHNNKPKTNSKRTIQLKISDLSKVVFKKDIIALKSTIQDSCRLIVKLNVGINYQVHDRKINHDFKMIIQDENKNENHGNLCSDNIELKQGHDDTKEIHKSIDHAIDKDTDTNPIIHHEENIRKALLQLRKTFISLETLKSCGIGKTVNSLTKTLPMSSYSLPDDIVKTAKILVTKWRKTAYDAMKQPKFK